MCWIGPRQMLFSSRGGLGAGLTRCVPLSLHRGPRLIFRWAAKIPLWTYIDKKRVQLMDVRLVDAPDLQPGQMDLDKKEQVLVLRCGKGALGAGKVKPDGSKVLSATECWNGLKSRLR